MKITALTSFCVDFYPEENKTYVGGNSLNFATQCKLSKIQDVTVVGATGNDEFGTLIRKHLSKLEIDWSRLYTIEAPTASNKIFIDANGDRYFKEDSWNGGAFDKFRLSEEDWDSIKDSRIVAMPAGDPNLKELLKRRNNDQLIAIDFLDYLGVEVIRECIDEIDVVFLSGKEEMLGELRDLASQKEKLIIPTLGAKGSIAYWGNKTFLQEAIEVENVIDTTGCGDAFQAAFCIEWVRTNDMEKALSASALAASKVLQFVGGVQ